jgi:hypothetical protein
VARTLFGFFGAPWDSTGGGTDHPVVAQDAALAWASDAATLSQDHVVGAQDASLAWGSEAVALTQDHALSPQDAAFALSADAVAIPLDYAIGVQDVTIGGYTPAQVAVAVWAYVLPASPLTPSSPYAIEDYAAAVWETATP